MAIRTTALLVKGVLGDEYDTENKPDLAPYITAASHLVDAVVACATRKGLTVSTERREILERWLAAHAYQAMDPGYVKKKTGEAYGEMNTTTGKRLEGSRFGQMALMLDDTGCLNSINKGARLSAGWLGKAPSEQIPYDDRD